MAATYLTLHNKFANMFSVAEVCLSYREPQPRKRHGVFCFTTSSLLVLVDKRGLALSPVVAFINWNQCISIGLATAVRKAKNEY